MFARPAWQARYMGGGPRPAVVPRRGRGGRPFTGVKFVHRRQVLVGGGTSRSLRRSGWEIAAVMNQFLVARGVGLLGDLNPLYEIAEGAGVQGPDHRAWRERRGPGSSRLRHGDRVRT